MPIRTTKEGKLSGEYIYLVGLLILGLIGYTFGMWAAKREREAREALRAARRNRR
jgi:hypothetical protein